MGARIEPTSHHGLIGMCGIAARAEGCAFVVIDVHDHLDAKAVEEATPSIDHASIELYDGAVALRFDDEATGRDAFTTISRDLAASNRRAPGAVDAAATFVGRLPGGPVIATTNSTGSPSLHVFDGDALVNEDATTERAS